MFGPPTGGFSSAPVNAARRRAKSARSASPGLALRPPADREILTVGEAAAVSDPVDKPVFPKPEVAGATEVVGVTELVPGIAKVGVAPGAALAKPVAGSGPFAECIEEGAGGTLSPDNAATISGDLEQGVRESAVHAALG